MTPEVSRPRGGLILTHSLSKSTWSARCDGRPVIARSSLVSAAELDDHTDPETVSGLVGMRSPLLVPFLGTAELDGTSWLLSEQVEAVPLRRLLTMASLTPMQAAYIAARMLAAVADLHRAELAHGRLHAANILITRRGQVLVSDWALSTMRPTSTLDDLRRADYDSVRAVLALLIRSADRPVARNHGRHDRLFATMDRIRTETKTLNPGRAARELDNVILATSDDAGAATLRAELAALVALMSRTSSPITTAPAQARPVAVAAAPPVEIANPAPAPTPMPTLPHGPLTDAKLGRPSRSGAFRWVALAVVALILVGIGALVGTKQGTSLTDRLLHGRQSPSPTKAAKPAVAPHRAKAQPARHAPRPATRLAPASAGFVTGLALKPLAACRPGSACPITVTIRLAELSGLQQMQWHFVVVNRCTGTQTSVAGGSMIAEPGWPFAFDTRTVQLPKVRSLSVVALTTAPVKAASPPLSMATGGGKC